MEIQHDNNKKRSSDGFASGPTIAAAENDSPNKTKKIRMMTNFGSGNSYSGPATFSNSHESDVGDHSGSGGGHHHHGGAGGGTVNGNNIGTLFRPFDRSYENEEGHSSWNRRFQRLQAFYSKYGHSAVPVSWALDPDLGDWACTQRQYFREIRLGYRVGTSKVDDTRWKQLESVHFPLDYENFHWTKRYNELQESLDGDVFHHPNDDITGGSDNSADNAFVVGDLNKDKNEEQITINRNENADSDTSITTVAVAAAVEADKKSGSTSVSATKMSKPKLNPTLTTWLRNEQEKAVKVWSVCTDHHPDNVDSHRIHMLERLGVPFSQDSELSNVDYKIKDSGVENGEADNNFNAQQ